MRRTLGTAAAIWMTAGSVFAHPHIFIDSGLHLLFDDEGRLAAVRVIWSYDELYSLLVLEDMQLDADYDGTLTPEEKNTLSGFDMNWVPGYEGDLYVLAGGEPVTLSGPLEHTADLADGRVVTTHVRAFEERLDIGREAVILQVYDPTFYTAYRITLPTRIDGRQGCEAQVFIPDLDAANQALLDALAEIGATETLEDYDFPPIGAEFAEEVRLTCAAAS